MFAPFKKWLRLLVMVRTIGFAVLTWQVGVQPLGESVVYARGASVTESFKAAVRAYRSNNLKKAAKILQNNLRRYPTHQPSLLLLARIYYGLGNITAAAKIFRRVPVGILPPYMLYDYGVTMFSVRDCDRAISALAKVSTKSKYRYLASFYLGVCHYRKRDLQRAEFFLRQASNLPANLAVTRRKFLEQLRDQQSFRQSGQVAPIAGFVYVPPPPPVLPYYGALYSGAQPEGKPAEDEKKEPVTEKPEAGFDLSFRPTLTFNRFGFEVQRGKDSRKTCFGIQDEQKVEGNFELRYDFAPFESGAQPNIKLNLNIADSAQQFEGDDLTACNGISIVQVKVDGTTGSTNPMGNTSSSIKSTPSVSIPVLDFITLEGSYENAYTLPKREFGEATSTDTYTGKATLDFSSVSVAGSVSSKDALNKDGQLTKNELRLKGELDLNFDKYDIGLSYSQQQNAPAPAETENVSPEYNDNVFFQVSRQGETFRLTGVVNYGMNTWAAGLDPRLKKELTEETSLRYGVFFSASLPLKITLAGGYLIEERDGMVCKFTAEKSCGKTSSEDQGVILGKAATSRSGFNFGLDYAPFDWIFGAIKYSQSEVVATVPKETAGKFREDFIDYGIITQFSIGLKYDF